MKKNLLFFVLIMMALVAFSACSSSDDAPADGDTADGDVADGDTPDGDGDVDDDGTGGGDPDAIESTDDEKVDGDTDEEIVFDRPCENNDQCETGWSCSDLTSRCEEIECDTAAECTGTCEVCDAEDYLCYPQACLDSSTCCAGTACMAGVCTEVEPCPTGADHIAVTGVAGLISEGETAQISQTLYNENNLKLEVSGDTPYTYASDDDAIVAVDAAGLLTGGTTSGTATITVTLACDTTITEDITVQNFNTVGAGDSRVVVFDAATGDLIPDVDVYLNGTKVTTVAGIAAFPGVDCATDGCDLHVLPLGFTYVTALGLAVNDILIPVAPNVSTDQAGGVKGHLDLDAMPEVLVQDIILAISLFAVPGNLADLNFEALIGEMVQTNIKIGQSIDETIPLPSGMEGYLSGTPLKDGYQVQGMDGKGTLWGLGGYADLGEIMELVTGSLGGDIEIGPILAAIMPLFENFYHGIMPGVEFDMIDKVLDVDDINGNEDFTDFVADFANFKDIGTDFGVTQKQSQSAEITFQNLPAMGEGVCADSAITLVGAMEDGVGFIPLGLNVVLDENEAGELDCKIGETGNNKTTAVFAPQHSGVSGYDYYTLSVALSIDSMMDKATDIDLSGIIARSSSSPATIAMPAYMGFMMDASYNDDADAATFDMTASKVTDASFHRVVFSRKDGYTDEQRYWHIYWAADVDGFNFNLPAGVDMEAFDNRADKYEGSSLVQAIALEAVTYDDLFGFNATNIDDMNGFINAFSMHALEGTSTGGSGCNSTNATASALALFLLLAMLPVIRRRFNN